MKPLKISLFASLILLQSSCVPLAVVGGAGAIGYSAAEERSVGTAIDDAAIEAQINAKFIAQGNRQAFAHITEDSNEGRVLLTGSVPDRQTKIQAYNLVMQVSNVRQVINELKVDSNAKFSAKQYASDVWISTQIESRLLFTRDIKSVNYSVETIDGVVYLMGVAQSREELDAVTQTASEVPGVQKVVSYVRLRGTQISGGRKNVSGSSLSDGAEQVQTVPGSVRISPQQTQGDSTGYRPPSDVIIEESPNAQ